MDLIDKYSKDKIKPKMNYKEGDVVPSFYNPFFPQKRISRKQKIWLRKIRKVLNIKIKHWISLGQKVVFCETGKQYFRDLCNKKNRLSSK